MINIFKKTKNKNFDDRISELKLVNYAIIPYKFLNKFNQIRNPEIENFNFSARSTVRNSYSFGIITAKNHPGDGRKIFDICVKYFPKQNSQETKNHNKFIEVGENHSLWKYLLNQESLNISTIIPVAIHSKKGISADFYVPSLNEMQNANTFEFGIERYLLWKINKTDLAENIKGLTFDEDMKKFMRYLNSKKELEDGLVFNNISIIKTTIDVLKNTDPSYSIPVYKLISTLLVLDLKIIYDHLNLLPPEEFKNKTINPKLEEIQLIPFDLRFKTKNQTILSLCDEYDQFYKDFLSVLKENSIVYKIFGDMGQSYKYKNVFGRMSSITKDILPIFSIVAIFSNIIWIFLVLEGDINFLASIIGALDISAIGPIFTIVCCITLLALLLIILYYLIVLSTRKIIEFSSKYIDISSKVILNKISVGVIMMGVIYFLTIIYPNSFLNFILIPLLISIGLATYLEAARFSILEIYRFTKPVTRIAITLCVILTSASFIGQNNLIPGQSCVMFKNPQLPDKKIIFYRYLTVGNWSDSTDIALLPGSDDTLPNGKKYHAPAVVTINKNDLPPTTTCPAGINMDDEKITQYYLKEGNSFTWVEKN
ncbi:MAG: hypothetical protein Q3974_01125 [Rothia sp. (in: high G+C Gram-positive bacteria)]|nr:hypothetical protein [Rothia sp. (in: high G+C Gram-positive bacteria)]